MKDMNNRGKVKCTIFLSYTSNMISSGVRETIKFLAKHHLVCLINGSSDIPLYNYSICG